MLGSRNAVATVAVKTVKNARHFYEGKLGLRVTEERDGVLTCRSGDSTLFVYESQHAGTNKATAVTWPVEDVHAAGRSDRARPATTLRCCSTSRKSLLEARRRDGPAPRSSRPYCVAAARNGWASCWQLPTPTSGSSTSSLPRSRAGLSPAVGGPSRAHAPERGRPAGVPRKPPRRRRRARRQRRAQGRCELRACPIGVIRSPWTEPRRAPIPARLRGRRPRRPGPTRRRVRSRPRRNRGLRPPVADLLARPGRPYRPLVTPYMDDRPHSVLVTGLSAPRLSPGATVTVLFPAFSRRSRRCQAFPLSGIPA